MQNIPVKVKRLTKTAIIPKYANHGDSGFDIHADVASPVEVWPGQRKLIATGLSVSVPVGYEMQIRPRSGLSLKNGITIVNTPGTVDSGYRGTISVILFNTCQEGLEPFIVNPGDRIAQGVICPVVRAEFIEADELDETERGDGGFGSTGVN